MQAREADELGRRVAALVQNGHVTKALALLSPTLGQRTPFRLLGRIGEALGPGPLPQVNAFLDRVADGRSEGGWVVIGSALGQQLSRDASGAFEHCRTFVIAADVWYATDILGERLPGPALVTDFGRALALMSAWRDDADRWVRRTVGVAAHFWAKRTRGAPESSSKGRALLAFLEPMFEERDLDAVKGVGWGLKTLGRYYPEIVTDWLVEQVVQRRRRCRALMLHKAVTYLPAEQQARVHGNMT